MTVVASPDLLPSLFASAWNAHDMAALARLFVEDADFVNVVGIWWRDRRAIKEAHEFAHRTFFRNSRLAIDDVAVKYLRPDLVRFTARGHSLARRTQTDQLASRGGAFYCSSRRTSLTDGASGPRRTPTLWRKR